jgi:hypothetical protein
LRLPRKDHWRTTGAGSSPRLPARRPARRLSRSLTPKDERRRRGAGFNRRLPQGSGPTAA